MDLARLSFRISLIHNYHALTLIQDPCFYERATLQLPSLLFTIPLNLLWKGNIPSSFTILYLCYLSRVSLACFSKVETKHKHNPTKKVYKKNVMWFQKHVEIRCSYDTTIPSTTFLYFINYSRTQPEQESNVHLIHISSILNIIPHSKTSWALNSKWNVQCKWYSNACWE